MEAWYICSESNTMNHDAEPLPLVFSPLSHAPNTSTPLTPFPSPYPLIKWHKNQLMPLAMYVCMVVDWSWRGLLGLINCLLYIISILYVCAFVYIPALLLSPPLSCKQDQSLLYIYMYAIYYLDWGRITCLNDNDTCPFVHFMLLRTILCSLINSNVHIYLFAAWLAVTITFATVVCGLAETVQLCCLFWWPGCSPQQWP